MTKPIALIGFYGSKNGAIGRKVAVELRVPFADMYEEIIQNSGMPLQKLFERTGEAGFRRFERLTLSSLAVVGGVVATTGGVALSAFNRRVLHEYFLTLFLDAPFDDAFEHISAAKYPTVGTLGRLELYKLYEYSRPIYQQIAAHRLDASQSVEDLANQILDIALPG